MNKVQKQFYDILSTYFSKDEKSADYSENKEELKALARANMCVPFFLSVASRFNVSDDELKQGIKFLVSHNYKNLSVQSVILKKLKENGIRCVVLKGASVSCNYPEPMLRTHGDIDILVDKKDYEKSIDILTESKERDKLSTMHSFHYEFYYEGILVEIHRAISSFEHDEENIKKYAESALESVNLKSIENFSFPVLEESYQAITLLLHTKRHYFDSELALKLLLDWAMYIDKIEKDEWNEKIYLLLDSFDLSKWADVLSCVCEKYLNINCGDKIHKRYDDSVIDDLAEMFISDRLKEKKEKIGTKEALTSIISRLNDVAVRDFEIVRKCRILMPLLWLVIVVRSVYRMSIGLRRKTNISEESISYHKKVLLFDRIKNTK